MPTVAADYDSDASAASTLTAATTTEDEPAAAATAIEPSETGATAEPTVADDEPKAPDDEPTVPDNEPKAHDNEPTVADNEPKPPDTTEPTNVEVTLEITEPDADDQATDNVPAGPAWADDRRDISAAIHAMAALTTADTPADQQHRPEDDAPTDPATRPGGKRKRQVRRPATKGDDDAPEPTA